MPRPKRPKATTEEERLERRRARARAWKARNKPHLKIKRAEWHAANLKRERENQKRFLAANPGAKSEYDRVYRKRHGDKIVAQRATPEARQRRNARARERYRNEPALRIELCYRASLKQALHAQGVSKKERALCLLGCSVAELKQHLARQFSDGMNWTNYGQWHIDHIRPCASFDLADPAQQAMCFHYSNLQPLWARDNQRKNSQWPWQGAA